MVMERKMLVMQWYVILFGKRRRRRTRRKEGMLKIKYKNIKKKIIKKNARSM